MMLANARLVRFALGGCCAALLAVIVAEVSTPVADMGAPLGDAVRTVAMPKGDIDLAQDADDLVTEITDHPLFSPTRMPPEPAQDLRPAAQAEKKPATFQGRLAGVMLRPGGSEAVFARDGQKPIVVTVGQEIEGWTVDAIEADHVLMSGESGTLTFEPTPAEKAGGAPAAHKPPQQKPKTAKVIVPQVGAARPAPAGAQAPKSNLPVQRRVPGQGAQLLGARPSQIAAPGPIGASESGRA
jgi:hypothetical protein